MKLLFEQYLRIVALKFLFPLDLMRFQLVIFCLLKFGNLYGVLGLMRALMFFFQFFRNCGVHIIIGISVIFVLL